MKEQFISALNSFADTCVFKSVVNCQLCKCGLESGKTLLMYAAECGNWRDC